MLNWWETDSIEKANLQNANDADYDRFAKVILRGVPDSALALEIGSGSGRHMLRIAHHFQFVYGVDISQTMVDYANGTVFTNASRCKTVKNDGASLPFSDNSFDFVYSFTVFQHMHTRDIINSYVRETYRVLRPGGMCRIQTVKGEPVHSHDGNHGWLFSHENDFLQLFLDAGFKASVKFETEIAQHMWVTGVK